jgi:hypothetical protein
MIGLQIDILPKFHTDADMVLLTEQAKADPHIIQKIKDQLKAGKSVCVTSGFVRAMKGKGIEDICEVEATGLTVPVHRFTFASGPGSPLRFARGLGRSGAAQMEGAPDPLDAPRDLFVPEIKYFNILTHDAWGDVLGVSPGGTTYPILLSCDYSKGKLYVLTTPNEPADLTPFHPSCCPFCGLHWVRRSPCASRTPRRKSPCSAMITTPSSCKTIYPRPQT